MTSITPGMRARSTPAVLLSAVLGAVALNGTAQELSPRAYWPAPNGTKVAVIGYQYSAGDVVTDPSLPILGVDSKINSSYAAYLQTLNLWGRTANVIVELPYSWGTTVGTLDGEPARTEFSGLADLGVTLSVNLLGAPTMTPADFLELRRKPRTIFGATLKVIAPTGSYDPEKLINISGNRWAVKAELGFIFPLKPRWLLEMELGTWFFGDNDDFLGTTREQQPVAAVQLHLVRRFKPGFWAALDANYYTGGRSTIDGIELGDLQRNSRLGATVVVPFGGRSAIKAGYSTGVFTESGGDFQVFLVSYQMLFR
jgi:hypothetical protein